MNFDSDDECTCDVGVFADCPVCRASRLRDALNSKPRQPEREKPRGESVASLALHYQKLAKEENQKHKL